MISNPIHVTFGDYRRLIQRISEDVKKDVDLKTLHILYLELERARKNTTRGISPNVVSMNSTVLIRILDTHEQFLFTLVYPEEENISKGKFSIYSPLATAVLGFSEKDEFYWNLPEGEKKILIEKVYSQSA